MTEWEEDATAIESAPDYTWTDPSTDHAARLVICENGAKALALEINAKGATQEFLAQLVARGGGRRRSGWRPVVYGKLEGRGVEQNPEQDCCRENIHEAELRCAPRQYD